jgi:hypothetical protein
MKENIASRKPDILFHPIVLGTMFLYFANNFLFQRLWPSQLTGKISDFAWLFFTPIVACSIALWIIPPQVVRKKNIDGFIWLTIALFFTVVKIVPLANIFIVGTIEKSFGFPITLVFDPTDLWALLSLLMSFYFWRTMKGFSRRASLSKSLLALSLVALLTIADAAAEDYGISCFEAKDGAIIASSAYADYVSVNGGETWNSNNEPTVCHQNAYAVAQYLEVSSKTFRARFIPGKPIELSVNGGKSWEVGYKLELNTQAQQAYYQKFHEGNSIFREGPLDAIIDLHSGNLLFAMGHEGVLLRKPDRTWEWVGVGAYQKVDYLSPDLYTLLWGEGLLALVNGMLTFAVLAIKQSSNRSELTGAPNIALLIMAWLALGATAFVFPPAITVGEIENLSAPAVIGTLIISFVVTIIISLQLLESSHPIKKLLIFSCLSACLFFTPYLFWFINWLPNYYFAPGLAFAFQIGLIVIGLVKFKVYQQITLPGEEQKEND